MAVKTELDKGELEWPILSHLQTYNPPKSRISSVGVYLPEKVVDNDELVANLEVEGTLKSHLASLLARMTGIHTRHYAPIGTTPTDLALPAAEEAIRNAGLSKEDIDTLIFASTDTEVFEPATANILQQKLGIYAVNSFDVKNACNSVLQAINLANSLIMTGAAKNVLIASGEVGSYACNRIISGMDELNIKIGGLTLGDAGAAIVIQPATGSSGVLEINLVTLGQHWPLCHVPENPSWRKHPIAEIGMWFYVDMSGLCRLAKEWTLRYFRDYFEYRKKNYGEAHVLDTLQCVIPHQLSKHFIEEMSRTLEVDINKVCITADKYGNTGSTTIPLALHLLLESGRLKFGSGQEILLYGAASGFNIGHIRLRM